MPEEYYELVRYYMQCKWLSNDTKRILLRNLLGID